MRLARWFRSAFASRAAARKSAYARRLAVESLEDRITPSGGLLQSSWSLSPSLGTFSATAVQPDGKIVAVGVVTLNSGYGLSVVRMNPNGSLDTTFNGTGRTTIKVTSDTEGRSVALQPDGKILVGGLAYGKSSSPAPEAVVARLNSNGVLDTKFGSKGVWTSTSLAEADHLALLPDGSIIGNSGSTLFKLTPTGALNSSFGTGGVTTFQIGGQGGISDFAVTTSGEIVGAGTGYPAGASGSDTFGCLTVVTPAGQLDTNFNGTGYLFQNFADPGWGTQFDAVATQGNTIVVAGYAIHVMPDGRQGGEGLVARYTLTGALDSSFNAYDPVANPNGTSGYFLTTWAEATVFTAIGIEPDGSIALAGRLHDFVGTSPEHAAVVHLSADGVLDTSFGTAGTGFVYFDGINDQNVRMSVGPDGSLLLSGLSFNQKPYPTMFARFTAG
jgi:uncharacterized delta-60 repeat protein